MAFSKDGYGVGFLAEISDDLELLYVEEFEDWNFTVLGYHQGKPVYIDDPILKIGKKDKFPKENGYGIAGIFDWQDGYVIVRYIGYEKYPYQHPLVSMSQSYGQTVMTGYDAQGNPLWQIVGPVYGG